MDTFRKADPAAPQGFFEVEAAGLRWLAAAQDGAPVVLPLSVGPGEIVLPRLRSVSPSGAAAEEFGRRLALTHAAGAPHVACPPEGWDGDGFIGPIPMPHSHFPGLAWGEGFARFRIAPFARTARDAGSLTADDARLVDRLCDRLASGDPALTGPTEPVARLHGDLWSGNVLWTPSGVVLIDPAAHGGHRESDLAMLALFGCPYLSTILDAYDEVAPLADGWRERVGLHQLFPLFAHVAIFGSSYTAQAMSLVRRYVGGQER